MKIENLTPLIVALIVCVPANANTNSTKEIGERIFRAQCEYCHGQGIQKGATQRLKLRYQGARPALLEERTDLTPDMITAFVRNWTLGMAPFRPTEITDDELDALIAFLTRNNPSE